MTDLGWWLLASLALSLILWAVLTAPIWLSAMVPT